MTPVVHDGVDLRAVTHHDLHERVHRRGAHDADGHGTTTDHMTELVAVGVATRRGAQIAHIDDIGPSRTTLPATLRQPERLAATVRSRRPK